MLRNSKRLFLVFALGIISTSVYLRHHLIASASPLVGNWAPSFTVADRMKQFGQAARQRWRPFFEGVKISYPPAALTLVGLKSERVLEVYARGPSSDFKLVRTIDVCAASGDTGPKLRQGDMQVPEGIYRISFLNPNSAFHLSLRLNYPNEFDREKGRLDGRTSLGGDIMIHGNCVSVGCLAVRDEPAEDLFILAADVGISNSKVILAPFDFRQRKPSIEDLKGLPAWTAELYEKIGSEFKSLHPLG